MLALHPLSANVSRSHVHTHPSPSRPIVPTLVTLQLIKRRPWDNRLLRCWLKLQRATSTWHGTHPLAAPLASASFPSNGFGPQLTTLRLDWPERTDKNCSCSGVMTEAMPGLMQSRTSTSAISPPIDPYSLCLKPPGTFPRRTHR